jgi:hypothetical protein
VISALGYIIPSLNIQTLQEMLSIEVADRLCDNRGFIGSAAIFALKKIIPLLNNSFQRELTLYISKNLDKSYKIALGTIFVLEDVIPLLKYEGLKEELAREIANKIDAYGFTRSVIDAFEKIIPSLKNDQLCEDLARKAIDNLNNPDKNVRLELYFFIRKFKSLSLLSILKKLATNTDFFTKFPQINYQLKVARAYYLIDKIVNYEDIIKNFINAANLFGNNFFRGVETASLLWIYQNLSVYLKYKPSDSEFTSYYETEVEQYMAVELQKIVNKLENGYELDESEEETMREFIRVIIDEVIKNELESDKKNYPSIGGKLHFKNAGREENMRQGILGILGFVPGRGFFAGRGEKEYLLPSIHSTKNLIHIITALKTIGLIQEQIPFQYTIKGRMMDEVKYIGWLMRGLLPEIKYSVFGYGKSDIGPHGDIVHGGGNLDRKEGEEIENPDEKNDRTDFLFLKIPYQEEKSNSHSCHGRCSSTGIEYKKIDDFEETIFTVQYFSYLLQSNKTNYQEFIRKLKGIYSKFTITKQEFEDYIKMEYESGNKEELLKRIDEIPWDNGRIKLDWIFKARWFNDTPRPSDYGDRYEAPWEGMILQVILHEAFKHYYEQKYGEYSWTKYLEQNLLYLYMPWLKGD